MSTTSYRSTTSYPSPQEAALQVILLGELAHLNPSLLPGVDGVTVEEMLHDYGDWAQRGIVPNPEQLARQYPELAAQIQAFFTPTMSLH